MAPEGLPAAVLLQCTPEAQAGPPVPLPALESTVATCGWALPWDQGPGPLAWGFRKRPRSPSRATGRASSSALARDERLRPASVCSEDKQQVRQAPVGRAGAAHAWLQTSCQQEATVGQRADTPTDAPRGTARAGPWPGLWAHPLAPRLLPTHLSPARGTPPRHLQAPSSADHERPPTHPATCSPVLALLFILYHEVTRLLRNRERCKGGPRSPHPGWHPHKETRFPTQETAGAQGWDLDARPRSDFPKCGTCCFCRSGV